MEKYYDVTVPIRPELAVYSGDPKIKFENFYSIRKGDPYNLLKIEMGSHAGTHVDAPFHFFQHGKTLEEIDIDKLLGPVKVVQLRSHNSVTRKALEKLNLSSIDRIIFKTDHSFLTDRYTRFRSRYVYIEVDACGMLVKNGIKFVGIDSFSIEKYGSTDNMCHKVLLGAGVVVAEMLDLKSVPPGDYMLYCFPMKIHKGDGAPARVILKSIKEE